VPFHFLLLHLQPHLHRRNRKDRRQAPTTVSLRTDDNGTPATWTLVLSSSKPLTGRTGLQSRRTLQLYWNHRRYHSLNRNTLPLPDKDSSQQQTTCLVGHPSIEATTHPAGHNTDTSQEIRIAPSLRIAPGHSGLHRSSRLPTTNINHRMTT